MVAISSLQERRVSLTGPVERIRSAGDLRSYSAVGAPVRGIFSGSGVFSGHSRLSVRQKCPLPGLPGSHYYYQPRADAAAHARRRDRSAVSEAEPGDVAIERPDHVTAGAAAQVSLSPDKSCIVLRFWSVPIFLYSDARRLSVSGRCDGSNGYSAR
jgi:hypothetical protein